MAEHPELPDTEPLVCQLWVSPLRPELETARESILDTTSLARYRSMKNTASRTAFLTARWLALKALRNIEPDTRWQLAAEGPSRLLNPENRFSVSISHTATHAAFAVSQRSAVGCDLESHRARKNFLALAQRFFTEEEYRILQALPANEALDQFYRMWTLKEACLKARHLSIAGHLNDVSFRESPNGQIRYMLRNQDSAKYQLFHGMLENRLHLALCLESDNAPRVKVFLLDDDGQTTSCESLLHILSAAPDNPITS